MENLIKSIFFHQWQRKLVAILTALVIWVIVNHNITETKTINSVPVRVINLPKDQTIHGLQSNGFLAKRITLTLTGTKDVIDALEPGDLEVDVDISNRPSEGIVKITKKNLVSLNPNINLSQHITDVAHPEFILKVSPVLTEEIPITIHQPIGNAPKGYEFLDIWPLTLNQTISGPQEQILNLKHQGLELTFNLDEITAEELKALPSGGNYDDEVNFKIPEQWKKVTIPTPINSYVSLNDPEAKNLHITFLREEFFPLKNELTIHVFFPLKNSETINPETYPLSQNAFVKFKNYIPILTVPLYAKKVSKLFLEIVKDNMVLELVAAPRSEREKWEWSVGFIDSSRLEDTYVAFLLGNNKSGTSSSQSKSMEREKYYRQRFRKYMQQFRFYLLSQRKLEIDSGIVDNQIRVYVPNALISPVPSLQDAQ